MLEIGCAAYTQVRLIHESLRYIFMNKDSEFLSFPTIYCGKTQPDNKERTTPVHYRGNSEVKIEE